MFEGFGNGFMRDFSSPFDNIDKIFNNFSDSKKIIF